MATATGELAPCRVIPEGPDTSKIKFGSSSGGAGVIWPPKPLKQGESARIDAIFVVPEESNDLRLLVLGGAPVPAQQAP